jgi:GTP-binding protein
MAPLLHEIIKRIPKPCDAARLSDPFALSVNTISTDPYLGRVVTGKVESGSVRLGDSVKVLTREGSDGGRFKVTKLFYLEGLQRRDVDAAYAGQIVSLTGTTGGVSDTVCSDTVTEPLPTAPMTPPVISMTFGPNTGPLAGKEGKQLTSSQIKNRLQHEVENNVTLRLQQAADAESIDVQGRGELQLGILVEQACLVILACEVRTKLHTGADEERGL